MNRRRRPLAIAAPRDTGAERAVAAAPFFAALAAETPLASAMRNPRVAILLTPRP